MHIVLRTLTLMLFSLLACSKCRADCCCPNSIEINSVPFNITTSNTTYCVTQNLTYLAGAPTAAITVDPGVHGIVIDFNGFELDLDPSKSGISMVGTAGQAIRDVLIKDGVIKSLSPSGTSNGINATNFNTVTVENMHFIDTRRGFNAPTQTDANTDLKFSSCVFDLKGVTGASRRGISLATIQGLLVEDCAFLPNDPAEVAGGGVGILLTNNAKNVLVQRSTFNGQTQRAIAIQSLFNPNGGFFFIFPSTNIQIDACEFSNTQGALIPIDIRLAGVSNVQITNSSFYSSGNLFGSIAFETSTNGVQLLSPIPTGLLVDNCTFTSTSQGFNSVPYNYVTLFGGNVDIPGVNARDMIISNSTFTHQGAPARADDIVLVGVEGVLIENCIFDSTATGRLENCDPILIENRPTKSANIHLGTPVLDEGVIVYGNGVRDVTIRANQFLGACQVGIIAETGFDEATNERITIEDNSITAQEEGILLENTNSSTIINNRVQGVNGSVCKDGVGIKIASTSNSNAIIDNVVSNNGTGILLECGAIGNLVKENFVFNNSERQIKEEKKETNKIECNTVFEMANREVSCSCSSSSSDW